MVRTTKEGTTVTILKQYRQQSNNYINEDSKIYADLYLVRFNNGSNGVICATELENNGKL